MTSFLNDSKFKAILTSRFPIIFIDEYQDTNKELAAAIVRHFIEEENGPLIGLFGDHWQKIYDSTSCGLITASDEKLYVIGKEANFRSDRLIVESLNKIRPELIQNFCQQEPNGSISIYHSNNWQGIRRVDGHWKGDLPVEISNSCFEKVTHLLTEKGWDFTNDQTKILFLTHNALAEKQGYNNLTKAFIDSEKYLKKSDDYMAFLLDIVEPGCSHFESKKYGDMFKVFNISAPKIKTHNDKRDWNSDLEELLRVRESGTVGDIIDLLKRTQKPKLTSKVEQKELKYSQILAITESDREETDVKFIESIEKIRSIPFKEVINFSKFIDDKTPFSTQHGVKGAEFENVLVVCGRGWNLYNWNQMLEWFKVGVPNNKIDTFQRNRNLFYVACSRAKKNLAVLFTQELSNDSIEILIEWFGDNNIMEVEI